MLTQKHRPKKFSEVIGQPLPVAVMKSLVRNPDTAPKTFIFQGEYGTGKSSLARVVAKALSCHNRNGVEPCLSCPACHDVSLFTAAYQEYDITQVGNVDFMRALKSDLQFSGTSAPYRLVIFDEAHAASKAAMSALLKVIEDVPDKTFFIFTTTEVEKMLPTIRSRSIELSFNAVPDDVIESHVRNLATMEDIRITDELVKRIVNRSGGHVRNALMMLELCQHVQMEEYGENLFMTSEHQFVNFLMGSLDSDREKCKNFLQLMINQPLSQLQVDVERAIMLLLQAYVGENEEPIYKDAATRLGQHVFSVMKLFSAPWAVNSFRSDLMVQALMWYVYSVLKETAVKKTGPTLDGYKKQ